MTTAADKTQLGLTDAARDMADEIVEVGGFKDRQDAYRLAVAIALAEDLAPAPEDVSRTTYVNIGGLDPNNELRAATLHLRSDHNGRPGALIERLAEVGIERIHAHMHAGKPIRELLQKFQPATVDDSVDPAADEG
jgi:hypothetical protein